MMKNAESIGILIVIIFLLVYYFFGSILFEPNSYFFEVGSDAIKSYYIPAYFIKYDHGIRFSGMNYPFGEHVMYTDNQFPITYFLQFVEHHLFEVSGYTTAIVNYLMIFSFFPCAVFIFLILTELKVERWYAIFTSVVITFLSPQVLRMQGHFSLAYVFFIPMILYLLLKMLSASKKVFIALATIVVITFFGLIHLYYLAIIEAFLFCFVAFYCFLQHIRGLRYRENALYLLSAIIIPTMVVELFIFLTDPVSDRITTPWGFFVNYASRNSVFKPPNWNYLKIFGENYGFPEGYAYIGLAGLLMIVLFFIKIVRYLYRGQFKKILLPPLPDFLLISLYASVPVLLFAMAYPFRWCPKLLDYIPVVRQFRSTGRFAWIFYYSFSIFAAYYFFILIRTLRLRHLTIVSYLIFAGIITFWALDGFCNLRVVTNQYKPYRSASDYFSKESYSYWLKNAGYTPDQFQAVLSFPFFHVGSEKFWLDPSSSLIEATKASYDTGLPTFDSYLARTSLSQTLKEVQFASSTHIEKNILQYLKKDKPVLLIVAGGELSPSEKVIISKADSIYSNDYIKLYRLSVDSLRTDFKTILKNFLAKKDLLFKKENYFTTDSLNRIIIDRMNSDKDAGFLEGAVKKDSGDLELFAGHLTMLQDSEKFEISVWEKAFIETYDFPWLYYRQYDAGGKPVAEKIISPKSSEDVFKDWVRCSLTFTVLDKQNTVQFFLRGKKIEAGELLIRPVTADVYYQFQADSSFVFNNYLIHD